MLPSPVVVVVLASGIVVFSELVVTSEAVSVVVVSEVLSVVVVHVVVGVDISVVVVASGFLVDVKVEFTETKEVVSVVSVV